jgi:hypothetical protein
MLYDLLDALGVQLARLLRRAWHVLLAALQAPDDPPLPRRTRDEAPHGFSFDHYGRSYPRKKQGCTCAFCRSVRTPP